MNVMKLKLLTNCEREVKEDKLTTKKTTNTDQAIRIAKQTRSYKKHYLVTLNPFYLLDCYENLMGHASFMIRRNGMIPPQSYQTG